MLLSKQKKNQASPGNRILISVTVIGSAGPIRLLVNSEELVSTVIDSILRSYARVGRLPILGTNTDNFYLSAGYEGNYTYSLELQCKTKCFVLEHTVKNNTQQL